MVAIDATMLGVLAVLTVSLLVIGIPIWLVFFISSTVTIYLFTTTPMTIIVSAPFGQLNNFILLAVPGFIFVGELMARGGMADRLIDWLRALVGPVPGGIPISTVAASESFGAISGSSAATVAAIGKILYPALQREGYSDRFGLGLLSSCGAIAIVIPPSISMILFAAVAEVSVGRLFLAGVLPGLILGGLIVGYSIVVSYRRGITKGADWDRDRIVETTRSVLWTLGLPVIIFGGIYGGFTTVTEAAGAAAAYAVVVSVFVHSEITLAGVWDVARSSAELTSKIFLITAAAGLFSWLLTTALLPQYLGATVTQLDIPVWAILLLINVILILAGMFVDPVSNVLILTPVLLPVAEAAGLDPIHFGVVMVVNMAIGMFTPPIGLNIFVVSSIFDASTTKITRGVVPFFVIYLVGLLLITYVPSLSLWLPELMN